MTGKPVAVTTDYREKLLQRALLQYSKPENANLVREALKMAGREDLIGNTPDCLVRPAFMQGGARYVPEKQKNAKRTSAERNGAKKASLDRRGAKPAQKHQSASARKSSKTKFDRIFGEDAERIRREASRLSSNGTKSASKSSSRDRKSTPKGKKR